jgi:hypothetical protein
MPHTTPLKPSVTLIHTTFGDLVQVQDPDAITVPGADAPTELRKGEVVQCLRNDEHGVLIARGDGSRMLVPVQSARTVGIRWFSESLESEEPGSLDEPDRSTGSVQEDGRSAGAWGNGTRLPRTARGREKGRLRRDQREDAPRLG